MQARKLAGWFLIVMGLVNITHAIHARLVGEPTPGPFYALLTAGLGTAGTMLLCRLKQTSTKA